MAPATETRQKILKALAEFDPLNITVPPLLLCFRAGYKATDTKTYRVAFKSLKDDGFIKASSKHVELTEKGRSIAPLAKPLQDDAGIQSKFLELLLSKSPKEPPLPPAAKTRAIFAQLLVGRSYSLESMAKTAGYNAARPMDSKAFRNLINKMKKLGILEKGEKKDTWQFTNLLFPVKGRPKQANEQTASPLTQEQPAVATTVNEITEEYCPMLNTKATLPSLDTSKHALPIEAPSFPPLQATFPASAYASMPIEFESSPNDGNSMSALSCTTPSLLSTSPNDRKRAAPHNSAGTPENKHFKPGSTFGKANAIVGFVTAKGNGMALPLVTDLVEKTPPPSDQAESYGPNKETCLGSIQQGNATLMEELKCKPHGQISNATKKEKKARKRIGMASFWSTKPRV